MGLVSLVVLLRCIFGSINSVQCTLECHFVGTAFDDEGRDVDVIVVLLRIEQRLNARLDALDGRLDAMDARLDALDARGEVDDWILDAPNARRMHWMAAWMQWWLRRGLLQVKLLNCLLLPNPDYKLRRR